MSLQSVQERVQAIVTEQLRLDKTPGSKDNLIEAVGADSLDMAELTMALEKEFSVEFSDAEKARMLDIASILEMLKKKGPL